MSTPEATQPEDAGRPTPALTLDQRGILVTMGDLSRTWLRPMDLGGRDGSRHSVILTQLVRKGFRRKQAARRARQHARIQGLPHHRHR